jgi:PAS domain-containing protein
MGTWLFEPGHTAAMFRARHMMVTHVRGHFNNVTGSLVFDPENLARSSADVAIDAAAIWTGQPQRDAHLRSSRIEPLRGNDGTLLYWIGINLDIEERKQAEFYLGWLRWS